MIYFQIGGTYVGVQVGKRPIGLPSSRATLHILTRNTRGELSNMKGWLHSFLGLLRTCKLISYGTLEEAGLIQQSKALSQLCLIRVLTVKINGTPKLTSISQHATLTQMWVLTST